MIDVRPWDDYDHALQLSGAANLSVWITDELDGVYRALLATDLPPDARGPRNLLIIPWAVYETMESRHALQEDIGEALDRRIRAYKRRSDR